MDALIKEIRDLTETVKEHRDDPATLDEEMIVDLLMEKQEELMVVRAGENGHEKGGELVGPPGWKVPKSDIVRSGKFAGTRRDELAFTSKLLRIGHRSFPSHVKLPSEELQKALTADGSGTGDELVPTSMAAELWQDFFLQSRIVSNIGTTPMPTDPFNMPLGLGDVTWRKGTQNTATTASDPSTADSTLTSTEQVCEVNWSYNLDEDAVLAVMPALRQRLQISGALQMDKFVLNADDTDASSGNINSDDANPDNDKYYLSNGQDGIRHLWLVDNSGQGVDAGGDALTDADILNALSNMGKYAVNPESCVMFADPSAYIKGLMDLDAVQTLDKYGEEAVVMTGELGKYRGISIVPTGAQALTEADGKVNDGGGGTLGQISIVNKDFWTAGFRRELLIEVDRDIQARSLIMVVSFRIAVAAHGTRASATHTAGIYNISV
jgi:HK97 family phage major capsid protein